MRNVINLYNEKFKNIYPLEYPKTDLQMLKAYRYLSSIPSVPIQEALKDVKLPKINSWKDYFCLNEDRDEYYTIDLSIDVNNWDLDEIEDSIRKGKTLLAEDDEGMIYLVKNVTLDLTNKKISLETINNTYSTIIVPK